MDSNNNTNFKCDPEPLASRWLILSLVGTGTFMSTLDVSIVNVALPVLTRAFDTNVSVSQWFVLAYTFTITVLLAAFGRLGDINGRRPLYIKGIIIFTLGSVACAAANSALMLSLARVLQGVGSAITMSSGPALVAEGFPARERGCWPYRNVGRPGTSGRTCDGRHDSPVCKLALDFSD
mgnify:CR=1 FL=1